MKAPLPVVEGVAPSRQHLPPGPWRTVLEFLTERHPNVGEAVWLSRMERGEVVDERGARLDARSAYRAGGCVFYYREPPTETPVPFEERVVYSDEHILVADKPHFLSVVPAGRFSRETLLARLKRRTGLETLVPVHRIDRETAGLVLFSHDPATRGLYTSLFQRREVEKVYEALAPALDVPDFPHTRRSRIVRGEPFFRMKEVEGGPNSETHIEVIETHVGVTDGADSSTSHEGAGLINLYRLRPVTGRKHQLRLHLSAMGAPVVNDRLYPEVMPDEPDDFSRPLKLVARGLSFRDPVTGRVRRFESELKL
ncbi:MAG TPA: pseudouridine synthase [Pyrinomonadaceae bacterium]|nr:pseudouridine synthase [Pyrinomonadaceae bacterium]